MNQIKHAKIEDISVTHKCEHEGYEYYRRRLFPVGSGNRSLVSVYEIPPQKAAYPYHFHHNNEETFYILKGEGILRTPEGERKVSAGELIYFPTGAAGAHKLTNSSETETLVYIDFDVICDVDITIYPDSDKIGVWGMGVNQVYPRSEAVDYYCGE